jgi:hypothetical protein
LGQIICSFRNWGLQIAYSNSGMWAWRWLEGMTHAGLIALSYVLFPRSLNYQLLQWKYNSTDSNVKLEYITLQEFHTCLKPHKRIVPLHFHCSAYHSDVIITSAAACIQFSRLHFTANLSLGLDGGQERQFHTSALAWDGYGWSASHTGHFIPWYPFNKRLGGPQNIAKRKISGAARNQTLVIQPTAQ